ncbi:unnamed protein product [Boreogadus saida]
MIVTAVLTCYCIVYLYIDLWKRIRGKKKTQKQERKFDELIDRYNEKSELLEMDWALTDFEELIPKKETPELERECYNGAAGEGTPGPSSTPLLSTELPAGLETSIPPVKHSLLKKLHHYCPVNLLHQPGTNKNTLQEQVPLM